MLKDLNELIWLPISQNSELNIFGGYSRRMCDLLKNDMQYIVKVRQN